MKAKTAIKAFFRWLRCFANFHPTDSRDRPQTTVDGGWTCHRCERFILLNRSTGPK